MICLKCAQSKFREEEKEIEQELEGKTYLVKTPVMVCANCQFIQFTDAQATRLIQKTRDLHSLSWR